MRYAFELAAKRPQQAVTSATKSNGIIHTMPFWDERFARSRRVSRGRTDQYHIDILAAHFVSHPDCFDVVVGSNLFGDILSDLGPAVDGDDRHRAVGQHQPERRFPSMFEPVHGSAPDIAGKGIANPIGQIWSGAMMLDHLGGRRRPPAHRRRDRAGARRRRDDLTPDMGGTASTTALGAGDRRARFRSHPCGRQACVHG